MALSSFAWMMRQPDRTNPIFQVFVIGFGLVGHGFFWLIDFKQPHQKKVYHECRERKVNIVRSPKANLAGASRFDTIHSERDISLS